MRQNDYPAERKIIWFDQVVSNLVINVFIFRAFRLLKYNSLDGLVKTIKSSLHLLLS